MNACKWPDGHGPATPVKRRAWWQLRMRTVYLCWVCDVVLSRGEVAEINRRRG